jgi:hypothetical protein
MYVAWKKNSVDSSSAVTESALNGNLIINGIEITVYDDNSKADKNHNHSINSINEIESISPSNEYVLTYDSQSEKYKPKPLPVGTGSGATNLEGLSDVDVMTNLPVDGNTLVFDNGIWKPKSIVSKGQEDLNYMNAFDIDYSTLTCEHADNNLIFPGIDVIQGDFSVVHPSVVYYENGWNGHKYWMAINPYPKSQASYENPWIYCSKDGVDWVQPEGIVNPIAPEPTDAKFSSDVHLVKDVDGKTLHCISREYDIPRVKLRVFSSIDGVTWTGGHIILDREDYDFASPCVLYEDGKYRMYAVDVKNDEDLNRIEIYESESMTSPFVRVGETYVTGVPEGRELWHMEIRKINGLYVLIYSESSATSDGVGGKFRLAKSHDLVTWDVYEDELLHRMGDNDWRSDAYKSTFLLAEENGKLFFKLWYGTSVSNSDWYVGYTEIHFNKRKSDLLNDFKISDIRKIAINSPSVVFYDDFSRADGSVGNPVKGSYLNSTAKFQIQNNKLVTIAATGNELLTRLSSSNYEVRYHVGEQAKSENQFFIIRKENGSYNRISFGRWDSNGCNAGLLDSLGGLNNRVKFSWTIRDGDIIQAICVDNKVHLIVNGVHRYTHTILATGYTAQEVGINFNGVGASIEKIIVESL